MKVIKKHIGKDHYLFTIKEGNKTSEVMIDKSLYDGFLKSVNAGQDIEWYEDMSYKHTLDDTELLTIFKQSFNLYSRHNKDKTKQLWDISSNFNTSILVGRLSNYFFELDSITKPLN